MKKKSKWNKWFLLNWKKLLIFIGAWFVAIILHNLTYTLFKSWFDARGGDEAFFFIIANIVIPLYFVISLVYTLVVYFKKK